MDDKEKIEAQVFNSYLTFMLGNEHFAVDVIKVEEILEVPKITNVPRSPDYLRGVINLRGNVLPVIDTRVKFNMSETKLELDTCIVVLELEIEGELITLGALVDAVTEVIELQLNDIKPSPSIGSSYHPEFIEGVTRVHDNFIMLLNIGKVFSIEDVSVFNDSLSIEADNQ
jgi:purine-binding chemotaxis protein CheW